MARRSKKPKTPSTTPAGGGSDAAGARADDKAGDIDPNLALFASYVQDDRQRAQAAKRAARQQRRQAEEADALVRAKDAAAAEVKRLRSRTSATAEERAAADTAYREALAAVVAAETGETPAWAPPPSTDDPAEAESTSAEPAGGEDASTEPDADTEDGTHVVNGTDVENRSGDGAGDRTAGSPA